MTKPIPADFDKISWCGGRSRRDPLIWHGDGGHRPPRFASPVSAEVVIPPSYAMAETLQQRMVRYVVADGRLAYSVYIAIGDTTGADHVLVSP